MLNKLEGVYLSILRVVILVVATIALVATGIGLIASLPVVASALGLETANSLQPVELSSYIQENKLGGLAPHEGVGSDSLNLKTTIHPDTRSSASLLTRYMNKQPGTNVSSQEIENVLMERYNSEDINHQEKYASSILAIFTQLDISKGKPLNIDRANELINWHKRKFDENIVVSDQQNAINKAQAMISVYAAAAAFLVFIATVFCFIFVKIERNLRGLPVIATEYGARE